MFNTDAVYPDECDCSKIPIDIWLSMTGCRTNIEQINNDLSHFEEIDFNIVQNKMIKFFNKNPHSMSICQYIVKNNLVRIFYIFYILFIQ